MIILFRELPKSFQLKLENFIYHVKYLNKGGFSAPQIELDYDEIIYIDISSNGRISAVNDYSTTVICFIDIKNNRVIPVRDKLPDIPRKDVGIKEVNGVLLFDGLGDSYNVDYGTYYEKLARGLSYTIQRQEVLLNYDIQYGRNTLSIKCSEDSPILNAISLMKNYSNISTEELAAIALLKHKHGYEAFPVQESWRKIFGQDSWRKDFEIIRKLKNEGLVKMEKIPKLTAKGITFITNLSDYKAKVDIPYIGESSNGTISSFIEWYESNKGKRLEDYMEGTF